MMMIELREGSLTFQFPDGSATKYDEWSFYRKQKNKFRCGGKDLKAVDFIFINSGVVWLIEVKDYRVHRRKKKLGLVDEVAMKVRDTFVGLVSARCNASSIEEREFASRILSIKRYRVVLHLEQPSHPSQLFPRQWDEVNLVHKLKTAVRALDPHPKVFNHRTPVLWEVIRSGR